jgi:hypothetical protein
MAECSGTASDHTRKQLVSATMDVSRAHLLLTGLADWVPSPVRPDAQEALDTLERAIAALRDASVHLGIEAE